MLTYDNDVIIYTGCCTGVVLPDCQHRNKTIFIFRDVACRDVGIFGSIYRDKLMPLQLFDHVP